MLSPNQLYLDEKQVAELLGVKVKTVQEWRYKEFGPRWIKLGPSRNSPIRYPRADLEAWIVGCVTGGGSIPTTIGGDA